MLIYKLDASGKRIWNAFLGSGINDNTGGLAADGNGNVWVTGYSKATWGSPIRAHNGGAVYDVFVALISESQQDRDNTHTLTIRKEGTGTGTVSGSPVGIAAGVNQTAIFFEVGRYALDGFGSSSVLRVGDTTWFAGLSFEL